MPERGHPTPEALFFGDIELRPIRSAPSDDYMAGADGHIYSRKRYTGWGNTEKTVWYPLVPSVNTKGYLIVSMSHEGTRKTRSVHVLICEAFHGPKPAKHSQVRHLDGDRKNPLPTNLTWGTQIENWADRKAHGRGIEGEKHPSAKFTDFERKALRWALDRNLCSQRHAARVLHVSQGSVAAVQHGTEPDLKERPIRTTKLGLSDA